MTFLLTDIARSTQLWQSHPNAMPTALERHDRIVAEAVEGNGGFLIRARGEGDSWFAVFSAASNAIRGAVKAQSILSREQWPDGIEIKVRIALHTGEAELREGTYYGSPVNRCARLRATAHGGQVILSLATQRLIADHLPAGASLRDLGWHRLKDLADLEHVFQLCHASLPGDFPPLLSLDPHNNLPIERNAFIGREQEIVELQALLSSASLLTLTGSGGAGKSRLAIQLARRVAGEFAGGTWLVQLAPVSSPDLLLTTVAATLDLPPPQARTLKDSLREFLAPRKAVLILDNCEHLVRSTAELAEELLDRCAGLKIVATSREPLRVSGELAWRVPPLSLPELPGDEIVEAVTTCDSARLFIARARLRQPDFQLTQSDAAALGQICRRLDGMPLAIELAATRVQTLTVAQIAARLDDRFSLLTGGVRTALPRQQTLRVTVDWSYGLLLEAERVLLNRLAVFRGGFTLDDVEAVCAGRGLDRSLLLDLFLNWLTNRW